MDSFESIVAMLLERKGYWIKKNFKVNLTKEEKRQIGRPSSPRWELDLIAYKAEGNELLVVECKSYLDSPGVGIKGFEGGTSKERYKLFNEPNLWQKVCGRLIIQLQEVGACTISPSVKLCLAAGKVASEDDRKRINELFNKKGWRFYDEKWIREELLKCSECDYENEVAIVVSKLLSRQIK